MWADNETATDLLGFSVHKNLLLRLVTDDRMLPVTVGVFGDWGGGKSSVMRMLQRDLQSEEHEDIACLYFNGWMFEGYDDAKAALLSSILMQLGEHKRFGPQVRDRVVPLLKQVNYMRAASMIVKRAAGPLIGGALAVGAGAGWIDPHVAGTIGAFVPAAVTAVPTGGGAPNGATEGSSGDSEQGDAKEKKGEDEKIDWQELIDKDPTRPSPLDIRSFRSDFARLLADTDLRALVVLIDDLDRCEPTRLIENLEAIKLFLAVPKMAFVIAADERIVRHAIASRYAASRSGAAQPAGDDSYDLVTDYLEKLIQVPYHLPRLSPSEIESYITLLFCQLQLDEDLFGCVHAHCEAARKKNLYITYGAGMVRDALSGGLPATLEEQLFWSSAIAPTLTEGLKGNPRQVKRFLNALLLRKQLAEVAGLTIRDDVLVKLMLLEYSQGKLFDRLYEWQARVDGPVPQLVTLEAEARGEETAHLEGGELPAADATPWSDRLVQDWLLLEPTLADIDLRDYFWVARDKLHSTMSGLSMVPPLVRTFAQELVSDSDGERLTAAKSALDLNGEERAALLRLLGQQLRQRPDSVASAKGFVAVIDVGLPGALDGFIDTLGTIPPGRIEPNIPYDLQRIALERQDSASTILPFLTRLGNEHTVAGAAAKDALTDLESAQR